MSCLSITLRARRLTADQAGCRPFTMGHLAWNQRPAIRPSAVQTIHSPCRPTAADWPGQRCPVCQGNVGAECAGRAPLESHLCRSSGRTHGADAKDSSLCSARLPPQSDSCARPARDYCTWRGPERPPLTCQAALHSHEIRRHRYHTAAHAESQRGHTPASLTAQHAARPTPRRV